MLFVFDLACVIPLFDVCLILILTRLLFLVSLLILVCLLCLVYFFFFIGVLFVFDLRELAREVMFSLV